MKISFVALIVLVKGTSRMIKASCSQQTDQFICIRCVMLIPAQRAISNIDVGTRSREKEKSIEEKKFDLVATVFCGHVYSTD